MEKIIINCTINKQPITLEVAPNRRLLDVLREDLGFTSVKEGCSEGECGACTVLLNGEPITSCCMLIGQVQGMYITTIEGISDDGAPSIVQKAFLDTGAVQCGFCIPGMVLCAESLLMKNINPTKEDILEAMSGNLCRCTGYIKIHQSVALAAERMRLEENLK